MSVDAHARFPCTRLEYKVRFVPVVYDFSPRLRHVVLKRNCRSVRADRDYHLQLAQDTQRYQSSR